MKYTQNRELFTEVVLELFKLNGLLNTEGDSLAQEYGLSSARWKVLGAIEVQNMPLTVSQVARTMGQSRQAVQKIVNAMHKDGFLSLEDNPDHKRAKLIILTHKGKEVYSNLEKKQIPWANQCSVQLNETQLKTTLATLRNISRQFDS